MILEVILENGGEQLLDYKEYFPEAIDAQEISITDPNRLSQAYVYKWFVNEETAGRAVSLMKLKGLNVSVIERSASDIDHIKSHRKFLTETSIDTLAEDITRLSGVSSVEPKPIAEIEMLGFQLHQVGFSTIRNVSGYFLLDDAPETGFVLTLDKLSDEDFETRKSFLGNSVCDFYHKHSKYSGASMMIVDDIPRDIQLQYLLKFEKPKSVVWFRNDFIEYMQRVAGIKLYGNS